MTIIKSKNSESKIVWRFSPSNIERYYEKNQCARGLLASSINNKKKDSESRTEYEDIENSLICESGDNWEKEAVDSLGDKVVDFDDKEKDSFIKYLLSGIPDTNKEINKEDSLNVKETRYFYHMPLSISDTFISDYISYLEGYGGNISVDESTGNLQYEDSKLKVTFSDCIPDLIKAEWTGSNWKLKVIDVKNAKRAKIGHKMQVALYVLILQYAINKYFETDGVSADVRKQIVVDEEVAAIWNKGKDKETEFELREVFVFLRRFLSETLKNVFDKIHDENTVVNNDTVLSELDYCLCQQCEWCNNYSFCIKWCKENEPMALAPYITPYAQRFLKDLKKTSSDVMTLDGFREFISDKANKDTLCQSSYWKKFLEEKNKSLNMLELAVETVDSKEKAGNSIKHVFEEKQTYAIELPSSEGISIFLTAQKSESYDRTYFYGIKLLTTKSRSEALSDLYEDDFVKKYKTDNDDLYYLETENTVNNHVSKSIFMIAKNPEAFDKLDLLFTHVMHQHMERINRANENELDFKKKLSVQTYVMDNYEIKNIKNALFTLFDNSSVTEEDRIKISEILFWIQGQELVETDAISKRPQNVMMFPIIVLSSVVNKLFILPNAISNSIFDINVAFCDFYYYSLYGKDGQSEFANRRSNVFRNVVINEYWHGKEKQAELLKKITDQGNTLLNAESDILYNIRKKHSRIKNVKKYPPFFKLQLQKDSYDGIYGKLLFEAKYEDVIKKMSIFSARVLDKNKAIGEGKAIHIKVKDVSSNKDEKQKRSEHIVQFDVLNAEKTKRDDIFAYVFVKNNDESINELLSIDDPQVDGRADCHIKKTHLLIPREIDINKGSAVFVTDDSDESNKSNNDSVDAPVSIGDEYLIYEYFANPNLKKMIVGIGKAQQAVKGTMAGSISNISEFYAKTGESFAKTEEKIMSIGHIGGYSFSNSQKEAMKQLYENNVTLLLGPPGTGKTDFISRATYVLSQIYRERGKNLKILIGANSHSAIENVLFAIAEKAEKAGITLGKDLKICKLDRFDDISSNNRGDVSLIKAKDISGLMSEETNMPVVIGSTCWSLEKSSTCIEENRFDLIIIDEASQVRLIDALLLFNYGNKSSRYLIVGDENQLSPIIAGGYSKDSEKPYVFGSVFRYLYDCSKLNMDSDGNEYDEPGKLDYIRMLSENYRMNDALVEYSARAIYGPEYKAPNETIGEQKLKFARPVDNYLSKQEGLSDIQKSVIEQILDPEYPLILCVVNHENKNCIQDIETEWILNITRVLENTAASTESKERYLHTSQNSFWGNSSIEGTFGIIAPHHEHINRIKERLSSNPENGEMTAPWGTENKGGLYVGTVDKLQGKQRQVVIVSYGVSNIERAISEGEFIFSRNRLNVSLTRAKKKTIVFLTEALLSYPIEALEYEDQDILNGLEFMTGFRRFMAEGECREYDLSDVNDSGRITVYRR